MSEIWDCSFDPYVIQPAKRQQYQYSREYIPGNGISQHNHSGIPGPLVKHFPKIASALSGSPGQPAPSSHLKGEKNPVHSASYLQLWITINSLEEQTSTSKHPRNSLLKENNNLLSSFSAPKNTETPTNIHQKWTLMQLLPSFATSIISFCGRDLQSGKWFRKPSSLSVGVRNGKTFISVLEQSYSQRQIRLWAGRKRWNWQWAADTYLSVIEDGEKYQ